MTNKMVYGAGEATKLTDQVADATIAGKEVHFLSGAFDEDKVISIYDAHDSDAKLRFVYDAAGDSGMIFVGNQLVSSKILDITTNEVAKKHFDPSTGKYVESTTEKVADKVMVKWFGSATDPVDNQTKTKTWTTEFDIIDTATVQELIKAAQSNLQNQIDDLKAHHTEDTTRLDTSVSGIETHLKSDVVSEAANGAIEVTPAKDANDYQTYTVGVKVDDTTVKVVDDALKVSTYAIKKVSDDQMEQTDGEKTYAAEYQLMQTAPDGTVSPVGDKINIAKDFLVSGAHVCTFKYVKEGGPEIVYGSDSDQWGNSATVNYGDEVTSAAMLPWSENQDGTWEQARLGFKIKYGHSYLHLVLNTKPSKTESAKDSDVYLDFTEIFETFKGDGKYIKVENGIVSLDADAVTTYVDTSLGIKSTFDELKAEDTSIGAHLEKTDASVNAIEASYVKDAVLEAPKADNKQFNTLKLTTSKDDVEAEVTVDVANETFYTGLNTALNQLQANDTYLAGLLTWEEL